MLMIVFILSGCSGKNSQVIVAYVQDTPVTSSEFSFYLNNVKQQMQGTELSNDEDWNNMVIDGRKAIEILKEQALDIATVNISYIKIYEALGKTFDDEATEKINKIKTETVSQYENDGYDKFLEDNNITDEFIDMLCKSTYCSDVLYTEFVETHKITEEDGTKKFDEYINQKMKEFNITTTETEKMDNIK